jgi:glycosyltransferase involved in cell wall biosynthesis
VKRSRCWQACSVHEPIERLAYEPDAVGAFPRVSVISIFFNAERFFREALESVLAQDFDDFELLLVDDGSTDASSSIAKEFASREPTRIRYLEHPGHANRGMSAARNLGLKHARGEYIAFIDADDCWRPFKLREQLQTLDAEPGLDVVGGSVRHWSSWSGGKDQILSRGSVQDRPLSPPQTSLSFYPLGAGLPLSLSNALFRKSAIDRAGGFEEEFTGYFEDQAFFAKFYLQSTMLVTTRVWSDYRLHDGSCVASGNPCEQQATERAFFDWYACYAARRQKHNYRLRLAILREQLARRHPRLWRLRVRAGKLIRKVLNA